MSHAAALAPVSDSVRRAQAFAGIHCGADSRQYVANLDTRVELIGAGAYLMPATINDSEAGNAWVCSPLTTYRDYAREEVERHLHPLLGKPLGALCNVAGAVLERAAIDRAVALNNWLLSTNIYPALDCGALAALVAAARERWPDRALWFRSLNGSLNRDWIGALETLGFQMVASRQVYLFDQLHTGALRHRDLKRDLRALKQTPLQRAEGSAFSDDDFRRAETLYGQLYLQKYSRLNPQYSARFMQRWQAAGLLQLRGFRNGQGELVAVVGMFAQDGVMTAPLVGYDTSLPQALGLYRLLMASVFAEAMASGSVVNLSAGAANFKRLRGGRPAIEYSAVLASHMPPATRRAVKALSTLTRIIGIPVMRRFEL